MLNYYHILGIPEGSDASVVRSAYKALALQWHPDRNPGNLDAEEKFKLINEAYQTLSDPVSRAVHDDRLHYSRTRRVFSSPSSGTGRTQPYHYQPPAKRRPTRYKIDKEYHRINRIVLMIFFGLIGCAYALNQITSYLDEIYEQEVITANRQKMDSARVMFNQQRYETALSMVDYLISNNTTHYNFYNARDSMLSILRKKAMVSYQAENYGKASDIFEIVLRHEWRARVSTLQYLTMSMTRSGEHEKGIQLLKNRLNEDPDNLSMLYHISLIYQEELEEPGNAAPFLTHAKSVFKETHTRMYGSAFEMVAKPENIPEVYFQIFDLRSRVNMAMGDFPEAYTDCNWAVFIRPERKGPYERRIETGIKSNETARICRDINKLVSLGGEVDNELVNRYCN